MDPLVECCSCRRVANTKRIHWRSGSDSSRRIHVATGCSEPIHIVFSDVCTSTDLLVLLDLFRGPVVSQRRSRTRRAVHLQGCRVPPFPHTLPPLNITSRVIGSSPSHLWTVRGKLCSNPGAARPQPTAEERGATTVHYILRVRWAWKSCSSK